MSEYGTKVGYWQCNAGVPSEQVKSKLGDQRAGTKGGLTTVGSEVSSSIVTVTFMGPAAAE
jgi:hypothetical protein